MARVFIESFESQRLDMWDGVYNSSIVSTAGLGLKGDYCIQMSSSSAYIYKTIPDKDEYYFSFMFRPNTSFPTNNVIFQFCNGTTSVVKAQWIFGNLNWISGASDTIATGAVLYELNKVYFMQIYIKIATVGHVLAKANLQIDLDATHDTDFGLLLNTLKLRGYSYYDNIVIDDSEMPEETEIVLIKPNGAGYYSDWEPSSGANYTCIDEVPYNDSDYVASGIVNAKDTYTLESLPSNTKSIKCIQAQARGRKESDSPISRFNFVVREGSTNDDSSTFLLSESFDNYCNMYNVDPINSLPWYPPNVNNMEIGIKART